MSGNFGHTPAFVFIIKRVIPSSGPQENKGESPMSNNQDATQETFAALEALKEHYSLSSLTFSVPRKIQVLVFPVVIVVVWEALAEVGVLPASWLPAPSVVAAKIMSNRPGTIKRIIPVNLPARATGAATNSHN